MVSIFYTTNSTQFCKGLVRTIPNILGKTGDMLRYDAVEKIMQF